MTAPTMETTHINGRPITISDYDRAWYVPGETHIVDLVHPITGLTMHFKHDAAAIKERHPTAELLPWDDACRRMNEAGAAKFKKPVTEIDSKAWWYALEVLPPVGWKTALGVESFRMSERQWGAITAIYAKCGERYFTLSDDIRLPAEEIARRVGEFIAANPRQATAI